MVSQLIRQHIALVLNDPGSTRAFERRLGQLAAQQGQKIPAEAIQRITTLAEGYVKSTADLLDTCAYASHQAGVGHVVLPLLEQAAQYFLHPADFIPDHLGLYGLLDDAYIVHNLLWKVSLLYQQHTGVPLLSISLEGPNQVVRNLIGEPLASRLDQIVHEAIQTALVQNTLLQLQQQRSTTWDLSSRTGGPGSWGGTIEDEIARVGAELGISL